MPVDALPQPWPDPLPGRIRFRREFRDALGRPLTGKVTLTGRNGTSHGDVTIPPAPVEVQLVGGILDVALPPDVYRLSGRLSTKEGARVDVRDELTVEAS